MLNHLFSGATKALVTFRFATSQHHHTSLKNTVLTNEAFAYFLANFTLHSKNHQRLVLLLANFYLLFDLAVNLRQICIPFLCVPWRHAHEADVHASFAESSTHHADLTR